MKLKDIKEKLNLNLLIDSSLIDLNKEINYGYASDLLSDVLANAKKDSIWITLQIHPNIIGVASLKELAGIIIINNRKPEAETISKASNEKIPLFTTELPCFELIGKLYQFGIKGL